MPRVHVPENHAADPSAYVWSHYAPEIAGGAGSYIQAVYTKSLMSLRELEAARMRTAQINGCALCLGMRSARDLAGYLANSGVDPLQAVSARVSGFCAELIDGPTVVAVSHVSPIKAAVSWALGAGEELGWRMFLDLASITRIGGRNGQGSLIGYNDTGHLTP